MKTIEFSEEQLEDLSTIGQALFMDEQDPRSMHYVRRLVRPKVHWLRIGLCISVPLAVMTAFGFWLHGRGFGPWMCALTPLGLGFCYFLAMLKPATLCLIRIYQRYAPDALRNRCRFEPSCSEYMRQSIEKYGFWKGVPMGIRRLKRCNVNDGGFDYVL